jgi:hypothetical protein
LESDDFLLSPDLFDHSTKLNRSILVSPNGVEMMKDSRRHDNPTKLFRINGRRQRVDPTLDIPLHEVTIQDAIVIPRETTSRSLPKEGHKKATCSSNNHTPMVFSSSSTYNR